MFSKYYIFDFSENDDKSPGRLAYGKNSNDEAYSGIHI